MVLGYGAIVVLELLLSDAAFLALIYVASRLGIVHGIALAKLEDFPLYTWLESGVKDL
jgi:hypothetical protein